MKNIPTLSVMLLGLVLTVYLARQSDFSFSGSITSTLRRLAGEYRPSADLCAGVDLNNPVSDSQRSKAESFKSTLQSIRGGNPLKDAVDKGEFDGDTAKDYAMPLVGTVAPWIVLFFITFLLCIGLCCNWCCMYGCCKKCTACKCCKQPKESKKKVVFAGFAAVLLVCTFGASIAGISFSAGVPKGMDLSLCSFLNVVENLAYGKTTDKWIGISGAVDNINELITKFDSAVGTLTGLQTDITNMNTALSDAITTTQTNLYNGNKNSVTNRPDPAIGGTYKPLYIASLGPETDSNTFSGAIVTEMQAKQTVVSSTSTPINTACDTISTQQSSIKSALQSGKDTAGDINTQVTDILDKIKDQGSTVKDVTKIIGSALAGVFGANLGLAVFAFTSMVMVGVLKIKFFNKLLHLSWCVTFILALLGFLLSTLTYPLSVVMMEVCDVVQTALTDPAYLTKAFDSLSPGNNQAKDAINTCFYGDGDILSQFGIVSQMSTLTSNFDTVFDNLDTLSGTFDINSNTPPPSIVIPYQKDMVTLWKNGKVVDATESAADLVTLNAYVNKNHKACFGYMDTWFLNSINCTGSDAKFLGASSDTFDFPNPTCIGFDVWMSPAHSVSNRYTAGRTTCGTEASLNSEVYAQTFVNNFVTNRNTLTTVFGNVETALNAVQAKHDTFANSLVSVFQKLRDIKTDLTTIKDLIIGPTSIVENTNCKFIKNDLQALTDSMCVGFVSSLYQTSVLIILTSFFTLFSTIAVFCLAKRFLAEAEKKVSP